MKNFKSRLLVLAIVCTAGYVVWSSRVGDRDKVERYIVGNDPVVVDFERILSLPSYGISYFADPNMCLFHASYIWHDGLIINLDFRINVSRWMGTATASGDYNLCIQNLSRVEPSASKLMSYKISMQQWKAFVASNGDRTALWTPP